MTRIALVACLLTFSTMGPGYSQDSESGSGRFNAIIQAILDWLASQNQSDETTSSDSDSESDPAPGSSPSPGQTPFLAPSALAAAIAADAGGHQDQYAQYAEKLANTLTKLTAEQRGRVFKH